MNQPALDGARRIQTEMAKLLREARGWPKSGAEFPGDAAGAAMMPGYMQRLTALEDQMEQDRIERRQFEMQVYGWFDNLADAIRTLASGGVLPIALIVRVADIELKANACWHEAAQMIDDAKAARDAEDVA